MISCTSVKRIDPITTYDTDNKTGIYQSPNGDWCADPGIWFEMYKQRQECEKEVENLRNASP